MERDATHAMSGNPTLIVSYSGVLGGAERILLDCATRLGEPVVVACPEGALAEAVREAGLEHAALPERTLRIGPAHARGLAALAGDVRGLSASADAIVAWGARAVLAAAPLRHRPPLLAVHMDLLPRRGVAAAVRWATRRADGVAAASEAIAAAVATSATILRPGVDLDRFAASPPPDGAPRALALAALVPWKRPDLALEVAARVPGLQLELAGAPIPGDDGSFVRALEARAAAPDLAGRVTFLGPLQDPRPALARAHCLLHCADAEPWGLALVEALAAGRPVVAADAGGPREIVAGGAGRLFPPGDATAAAAALEAVLEDPDAPAAARARAERFPVEASAERFRAALAAASEAGRR
jgi:glycosyltransferase involved in cell wall biosynthesis